MKLLCVWLIPENSFEERVSVPMERDGGLSTDRVMEMSCRQGQSYDNRKYSKGQCSHP